MAGQHSCAKSGDDIILQAALAAGGHASLRSALDAACALLKGGDDLGKADLCFRLAAQVSDIVLQGAWKTLSHSKAAEGDQAVNPPTSTGIGTGTLSTGGLVVTSTVSKITDDIADRAASCRSLIKLLICLRSVSSGAPPTDLVRACRHLRHTIEPASLLWEALREECVLLSRKGGDDAYFSLPRDVINVWILQTTCGRQGRINQQQDSSPSTDTTCSSSSGESEVNNSSDSESRSAKAKYLLIEGLATLTRRVPPHLLPSVDPQYVAPEKGSGAISVPDFANMTTGALDALSGLIKDTDDTADISPTALSSAKFSPIAPCLSAALVHLPVVRWTTATSRETAQALLSTVAVTAASAASAASVTATVFSDSTASTISATSPSASSDESRSPALDSALPTLPQCYNTALAGALPAVFEILGVSRWESIPGAMEAATEATCLLQRPHLATHLPRVLPIALQAMDHHRPHVRLLGLRAVTHVFAEATGAVLRSHGWTDVVIEVLTRMLGSREPREAEAIFMAVASVLPAVAWRPATAGVSGAAAHDGILRRVIADAGMEDGQLMRRAYTRGIVRLIPTLGLAVVKHFDALFTLLSLYASSQDVEVRLSVIHATTEALRAGWPRITPARVKATKRIVNTAASPPPPPLLLEELLMEGIHTKTGNRSQRRNGKECTQEEEAAVAAEEETMEQKQAPAMLKGRDGALKVAVDDCLALLEKAVQARVEMQAKLVPVSAKAAPAAVAIITNDR